MHGFADAGEDVEGELFRVGTPFDGRLDLLSCTWSPAAASWGGSIGFFDRLAESAETEPGFIPWLPH